MREQVEWEEHARVMDGFVDTGFILLGGPLQGDREVLIVVEAASEDAIHHRLSQDPWIRSGMLTPASIEAWTILLGGVGDPG
jgi:uncharacterized protein YciI